MGVKEYENVTTFQTLEKVNLNLFRRLEEIHAEDKAIVKGDIMDGLIVGLDLLVRYCGTKKYKKRVFLITDGDRPTNCS